MSAREIEAALAGMSRKELQGLLTQLVRAIREREKKTPSLSLAGLLKGIADPEFDVDAALRQARIAWRQDIRNAS